jgi:hypothetical protein
MTQTKPEWNDLCRCTVDWLANDGCCGYMRIGKDNLPHCDHPELGCGGNGCPDHADDEENW